MKLKWVDTRGADFEVSSYFQWFQRMQLRDGTKVNQWSAHIGYYWVIFIL